MGSPQRSGEPDSSPHPRAGLPARSSRWIQRARAKGTVAARASAGPDAPCLLFVALMQQPRRQRRTEEGLAERKRHRCGQTRSKQGGLLMGSGAAGQAKRVQQPLARHSMPLQRSERQLLPQQGCHSKRSYCCRPVAQSAGSGTGRQRGVPRELMALQEQLHLLKQRQPTQPQPQRSAVDGDAGAGRTHDRLAHRRRQQIGPEGEAAARRQLPHTLTLIKLLQLRRALSASATPHRVHPAQRMKDPVAASAFRLACAPDVDACCCSQSRAARPGAL